MKKILVTDLLGTLIPGDLDSLYYLYGNGISTDETLDNQILNRAFRVLSNSLNEFLNDDNEINIVTCIDSHMSPHFLLENIIRRLYQKIQNCPSQIHIYFQTKNLDYTIESLDGYAKFAEANGLVTASIPDNIKIVFLKEKKDVFKFINYLGSLLFAIGDTDNDLGMLLESLSLGGQADFINDRLYLGPENFRNILTKALIREERIMLEQIAIKRYPNFFSLSKEDRNSILKQLEAEFITNEFAYNERMKLYDQAFAGEIDINKLYIENCVYQIINLYNMFCGSSFAHHDIIPESTCYNIGMYPTFTDYYNRVLKRT